MSLCYKHAATVQTDRQTYMDKIMNIYGSIFHMNT